MEPGSSGLLTHIIDFILSWTPGNLPTAAVMSPRGSPQGQGARCGVSGLPSILDQHVSPRHGAGCPSGKAR